MKKALLLSLLLASTASADTKIATVDMDLVILSHPKTEENREKVQALEEAAAAEHNQARGELQAIADKIKEQAAIAQRPTSADAVRATARAEAEKLRDQLQERLEKARRAEAETTAKIRREALDRFADIKKDVGEKLAAIAAAKGLDLILDSAATRSGMPLPLVVWSADALDLTDEAIAAVGGDRKAAEEALARGAERVFPGASGEDKKPDAAR